MAKLRELAYRRNSQTHHWPKAAWLSIQSRVNLFKCICSGQWLPIPRLSGCWSLMGLLEDPAMGPGELYCWKCQFPRRRLCSWKFQNRSQQACKSFSFHIEWHGMWWYTRCYLQKYCRLHKLAVSATTGGRHFEFYSPMVRLHCSTTYATDLGSVMAAW